MTMTCPSAKTLGALFSGELSANKKTRLIRHVFQCPKCRVRFNTLRTVRLETQNMIDRVPSRALTEGEADRLGRLAEERLSELRAGRAKAGRGLIGRFGYIYIGAAVLLVAGLSAAIFSGKIFPSRTRARASSPQTFRLLEPIGQLSAPPTLFSWTAIANADAYIIRIIDEDLRLLCEESSPIPFRPSEGLINSMQRGKIYIWSVMATDDFAQKLAVAQDYFLIR